MNWIHRTLLGLLGVLGIAPAVLMLYMGVLGKTFSEGQGMSAFMLFVLGVFSIVTATMP